MLSNKRLITLFGLFLLTNVTTNFTMPPRYKTLDYYNRQAQEWKNQADVKLYSNALRASQNNNPVDAQPPVPTLKTMLTPLLQIPSQTNNQNTDTDNDGMDDTIKELIDALNRDTYQPPTTPKHGYLARGHFGVYSGPDETSQESIEINVTTPRSFHNNPSCTDHQDIQDTYYNPQEITKAQEIIAAFKLAQAQSKEMTNNQDLPPTSHRPPSYNTTFYAATLYALAKINSLPSYNKPLDQIDSISNLTTEQSPNSPLPPAYQCPPLPAQAFVQNSQNFQASPASPTSHPAYPQGRGQGRRGRGRGRGQ